MLNRDVFALDPDKYALANEGVAKLTFPPDDDALPRLKGELQTFVCDGAYADGLGRILDRYNAALASGNDVPGVWISGFFGSGKSHLASMLAALWDNLTFPDGASAESLITGLPPVVKAPLAELRVNARRHGGAIAVGGTMGHGSQDPATAVAELVFRGVGLPTSPRSAEVALWLAREGILDAVKARLGGDFETEMRTFVLSEKLQEAILAEKPSLAANAEALADRLDSGFPPPSADGITVDDMERLVREALKVGRPELPLTLIVVDELQQFLGQNQEMTLKVQNIAERLSSRFQGRVLLVATGQQALTDLPYLQKLFDRFPLAVSLTEADIDTVIRRTVLRKKPEASQQLKEMLDRVSGEVHRQLQGSKLKHTPTDDADAPLDWPFLPARRRVLEKILRELDRTNLKASLRGQLRTTLGTARRYAGRPLGTAVAFDAIYEEISDDLLRSGLIPNETRELIEKYRGGDTDAKLKSRALMAVFLLSRIADSADLHGVRSRADTIADLLIEDLDRDHVLRGQVPDALKALAEEGAIIEVHGDWRLQTRESADWDQVFRRELQALGSDPSAVVRARRDFLTDALNLALKDVSSIQQGATREQRRISRIGHEDKAPVGEIFVRQYFGYETSLDAAENAITAEAPSSPGIHLLIPAHRSEEFSRALRERAAADAVLAAKGVPASTEGEEAKAAMLARRNNAEQTARTLAGEAISAARVMLAGGATVPGHTPAGAIRSAAERAIERLYPKFSIGDHAGWGSAVQRAQKKQPDALKAVGWDRSPDQHQVAIELLAQLGSGKKGQDLRNILMGPPFGWSQDAVDAILLVLSGSGYLKVTGADGQPVASLAAIPQQNRYGVCHFTRETRTLTAAERIKVRGLLTAAGVGFDNEREGEALPDLFSVLEKAAAAGGGDAPRPTTPEIPDLVEVRSQTGNDRLGAVADHANEWKGLLEQWRRDAKVIEERLPNWRLLQRLIELGAEQVRSAADAIIAGRSLLSDPDQVPPLVADATSDLRDRLNQAYAKWKSASDAGETALSADVNWNKLSPEERHAIRQSVGLLPLTEPIVDSPQALVISLEQCGLTQWASEAGACPKRVDDALAEAALRFEPKTQRVTIGRATIKDESELDTWLAEVRQLIRGRLADGPVLPNF
jgi:hypothetical protein